MTIPQGGQQIIDTKLAEAGEYGTLIFPIPSGEPSLRAANKSPKTIRSDSDSARLLDSFLRDSFGVTSVASITRDHIETFMGDTLERWKPTTAAVRYRSLQQLFKWLTGEGEMPADPIARMKPPAVPEVPVPVVSDNELRKLLKACEGPPFRTDATWPCCAPSSRAAAASVRWQGSARSIPTSSATPRLTRGLPPGGPRCLRCGTSGWRSRTMRSRYGASVADERARDEAHRLALGDRL